MSPRTQLARSGCMTRGANPFSIQRIAGHSSIVISQRYVHPKREQLEDAFSRLADYSELKIAEMKAKQKTEECSASVN